MMKDVEKLSDLNFGAVNEQFARAWQEVLRNITDPATEAKKKRELKISISVVPSEDRGMATTTIDVKTVLAPVKQDSGSVIFDFNEKGQIVARTHQAEDQGELFLNEENEEAANGR